MMSMLIDWLQLHAVVNSGSEAECGESVLGAYWNGETATLLLFGTIAIYTFCPILHPLYFCFFFSILSLVLSKG